MIQTSKREKREEIIEILKNLEVKMRALIHQQRDTKHWRTSESQFLVRQLRQLEDVAYALEDWDNE